MSISSNGGSSYDSDNYSRRLACNTIRTRASPANESRSGDSSSGEDHYTDRNMSHISSSDEKKNDQNTYSTVYGIESNIADSPNYRSGSDTPLGNFGPMLQDDGGIERDGNFHCESHANESESDRGKYVGFCLDHFVLVCKCCTCYRLNHRLISIGKLIRTYGCVAPYEEEDIQEIGMMIIGEQHTQGNKADNGEGEIRREYEECDRLLNNGRKGAESVLREKNEIYFELDKRLREIKKCYQNVRNCNPKNEIIIDTLKKLQEKIGVLENKHEELEYQIDLLGRYREIYNKYLKLALSEETRKQKQSFGNSYGNILRILSSHPDDENARKIRDVMLLVYRLRQIISGDTSYYSVMTRTGSFSAFVCACKLKFIQNELEKQKIRREDITGQRKDSDALLMSIPTEINLPIDENSREVVAALAPFGFLVQCNDMMEMIITNFNKVDGDGNFVYKRFEVPYYITSIGFYKDRMIYSIKNDHLYSIDFFHVWKDENLDKAEMLMKDFIVDWCDMTHLPHKHLIPFGNELRKLRILDVETKKVIVPKMDGKEINASYTISTTGISLEGLDFVVVYEHSLVKVHEQPDDMPEFVISAIKRRHPDSYEEFVEVCNWSTNDNIPLCLIPRMEDVRDGIMYHTNDYDSDNHNEEREKIAMKYISSARIVTFSSIGFSVLRKDKSERSLVSLIRESPRILPEQCLLRVARDLFFCIMMKDGRPRWHMVRIGAEDVQ